MALSSSMYAAVTGLSALGTGMQTISNNIANVNTVGFKAMRTNYEDLISQNYFSGGKTNQKGTGVRVSTIQSMFTQGAFMSSAQDTDMAIAGEGFFSVRNKVTGAINYTRAGVFTLNKDGFVEDPNGNILQGWKLAIPKPGMPAVKIGAPTDIKITVVNAPPAATTEIKMVTNLDADAEPVYEYKEHQLAFDYADPIAEKYAEIARDAAIFEIWNEFCIPIGYASAVVTRTFTDPAHIASASAYTREFDASRAPVIPAGPPNSVVVTVWFKKDIHFTAPDGVKWTSSISYSKDIEFSTVGGPYTVTSAMIGDGIHTSALADIGNMTINVSGVVYDYKTGLMANVLHAAYSSGWAVFSANAGITVPAGVPGTLYPAKVTFTSSINVVVGPPYSGPPPITSTVVTTVTETINFIVSSVTYTSSLITAPITWTVNYPYTSAYSHPARSAGQSVTFYTNNLISALPPIIDDSITAGIPDPITLTFSGSTLIRDEYGKLYNSAGVHTTVVLYFSASNVTIGAPLTLADLYNVAYVDHIEIQQTSGGVALLPPITQLGCLPSFFNARQDVDYLASGTVNRVWTQSTTTLSTSAVGVYVPAANPPATHAGDFYYQNVSFTNDITFMDVEGHLRTESVTQIIPVPFVMSSVAYTSSHITSPQVLYEARYSILAPQTIGVALSTALYNSAKVDFTPEPSATYDRNFLETYMSFAVGSYSSSALNWFAELIRTNPASALNALVVVPDNGLDWPPLPAERIVPTGFDPPASPYLFKIGYAEVEQFNLIAREKTELDAVKRGETRYATVYADTFKANAGLIEAFLPEWKLEGMGFAAAWDARDLSGNYIDSTGMHAEPMVIYDSLGSEHQLMIYYQKNPHMENVWDYIITCDPLEDARKDSNNLMLLSEHASFSGLIQKGKITFTGDGADRHGGVIKDLEAQNLDLSLCKMAGIGQAEPIDRPGFYNTYTWQNATIGGYYTGAPQIDPLTGNYLASSRTYEVLWGGVDENKMKAADDKWLDAFSTYMHYLDEQVPRDPLLDTYKKLFSTKVLPEDKVYQDGSSSLTWQERFERDWQSSASVQKAVPAASLPYGSTAPNLYGCPTGAARPTIYDKDIYTKGGTSLYWSGNINESPRTSGFTVIDKITGQRQTVSVNDKNFMGPYSFGSGLTVTFSKKDLPLKFGIPGQDGFQVGAKSEQIAWTNLTPNTAGVFDFDLAFVTSASMALHPPYPEGLPTITQHIAFDMGARNPNGLSPAWKVDKDLSTTQYAASNATLFKGQDGHAAGSLQRISIGEDGTVTGIFTNGFQMELYQIGLTRFINPWGLNKMGDNLFSETRYSGSGVMNVPGNAGTGTILSNFLEQSNTDVAEEIVNMILTQRGFQANSKTVTTTDTMLNEVIEMKR